MPTIKTNVKQNTQTVTLTTGDTSAVKAVTALCKWLAEHDKNAAAKDAVVNLEAVLKNYEKPPKPVREAAAAK